jgi:hypothetical protein
METECIDRAVVDAYEVEEGPEKKTRRLGPCGEPIADTL